jgi:ElaB/YqjD/DUF883 family membrane-anchored ribosome-binding protein
MAENNDPGGKPAAETGTFENLGRKLDERPEIQAAEEAVRRARRELEHAQQVCRELRENAGKKIEHLREQNVGDAIECTLSMVRKHPGPGLLIAAFFGFFLGRLFRR